MTHVKSEEGLAEELGEKRDDLGNKIKECDVLGASLEKMRRNW